VSTAETGLLSVPVRADARAILFEPRREVDPALAEFRLTAQVDRAHVVMLAEQGIVRPDAAGELLAGIEWLRQQDFAPLAGVPVPRGRYLAYESFLIDRLGEHVGGILHSGRSRNDLNATVLRLRLRDSHDRLFAECLALTGSLVERAHRWIEVVMPAYTHHQPAVPITYGHYLAGVAEALVRDLDQLWRAGAEIDDNPLGAGSVGGTTLPIDPWRTTALLGFTAPLANSLHAVASRDLVLRLLAAAAVLGVTLCRVAHDLQAWTGSEARLIRLGDDLVGSSSMMPQKRNPFLLEHIQGKATAALGAFTAAASAMGTARFTNAIAVGTEAVAPLWPALDAVTDAITLLRMVIEGAEPDIERMGRRAVEANTTATALAERLVGAGVPFRAAHHRVGLLVRESLDTGVPLTDVAATRLADHGPAVSAPLDPASVVAAANQGGGPGTRSVRAGLRDVRTTLDEMTARAGQRRDRWAGASSQLDREVATLIGGR
jgi:argininosuccinate lyase